METTSNFSENNIMLQGQTQSAEKASFPEQQISNKDFPHSWKFCGDTAEMLFSLTPNAGPVLTNTWASVEQSNMLCETRRCLFIQSTVDFHENNQLLSTARGREEQFLSPLSHGRRNQIIKCEKRRRKRERGWTFMHGYLPEATCSGVELASELAMVVYSKGPAVGKRQRSRPWQKRLHSPSMLHLANTDGCQGLASQACPLQVAPRPSEPILNGPSCCLHGLSSNDMPHSPLKLHRLVSLSEQWEERCWVAAIVGDR